MAEQQCLLGFGCGESLATCTLSFEDVHMLHFERGHKYKMQSHLLEYQPESPVSCKEGSIEIQTLLHYSCHSQSFTLPTQNVCYMYTCMRVDARRVLAQGYTHMWTT